MSCECRAQVFGELEDASGAVPSATAATAMVSARIFGPTVHPLVAAAAAATAAGLPAGRRVKKKPPVYPLLS